MKMRRAHRPRTMRAGANSVTTIGGLAAIAAFLPGHGPATPADPGPVAAPQDTVASQIHDFRTAVAVARQRHTDSALLMYKVREGDSISAVAVAKCHGRANDWTGIYAASRKLHLTARNANMLTIGQFLAISCTYQPRMLHFAPAPPPPPPPVAQATSTVTSSAAPVRHSYSAVSSVVRPFGSSYQQCVISRESGGNSQVMNSSGHYGLYQFDYGTWVSGGGAGGDFGHASVSEQNRVFASVYAARGTSPWSPYDGC
jgi:hypothetical protein